MAFIQRNEKNKIFQENYKKIFQEEIFKDKVDLIDEKI